MAEFNWEPNPDRLWRMDLETQSVADIKELGARRYLKDPSTRVMSGVFMSPDGRKVWLWVPEGIAPDGIEVGETPGFDGELNVAINQPLPAEVADAIRSGVTFAAHNAAGFDANAWEMHLPHLPQPTWYDTLPPARAAGFPGLLDAIGKQLMGYGKDEEGEKCSRLLSHSKVAGGRVVHVVGTPALWRTALRYNVVDVVLLDAVIPKVLGFGEPDVMEQDRLINERGVLIDRDYLMELWSIWTEAEADAVRRVEEITKDSPHGPLKGRDVYSHVKVKKWLMGQGLKLDSVNRQALEELYQEPEKFFDEDVEGDSARVVAFLRARQSATRTGKSKLEKAMRSADRNGRCRDMFIYGGAHTLRWAGRGLNPQSLPRGLPATKFNITDVIRGRPLTLDAVRAAVKPDKFGVMPFLDDAVVTLVRPMFVAEEGKVLVKADFSQIEARFVGWIADQENMLQLFSDPKADPYVVVATKIYGRTITKADEQERFIGKNTQLGCGFGMSARKFEWLMKLNGVDLVKAGTTPDACVDAFRDLYPRICGEKNRRGYRTGGLWKRLDEIMFAAVRSPGKSFFTGKCEYVMRDGNLLCILPSGRQIVYRQAAEVMEVRPYCKVLGLPEIPVPTVTFLHPKGYRSSLYGARLCENICQAGARDAFAAAMVKCGDRGLKIVMHTHDELVAEVEESKAEESLRTLLVAMTEGVPWSSRLPIGAEGYAGRHYTKAALRGELEMKALNGRIL